MKYIKLFKLFNENMFVGIDGALKIPSCIDFEYEDDLDIAFDKGVESKAKNYELSDNPYSGVDTDLAEAWNDGFIN